MRTIIEFGSVQAARDYRHRNGTGGWIFGEEQNPDQMVLRANLCAVLFPPEMTPTQILHHQMTRGRCGTLYAN